MNHKDLAHNGFKWSYDEDGAHFYSKQLPRGTWALMRLLPSDLTDANFRFMADHNLTNTNKAPRKKS